MCLPGKNNLSLDHILGRFQGQLRKSRATGAECQSCTLYAQPAMNDIRDTSDAPTYSLLLVESQKIWSTSAAIHAHTRILCTNIECPKTQASFVSCVDKIRALNGTISKHETLRAEVVAFRDLIHSATEHSRASCLIWEAAWVK
ncbi:hypothetical protein K503DRAFT_404787 [Rhizopogon vinicolor AM-OR11-026]|uniref:Uncharacterized protein n=1 Tax=Rhizopogon vinicolor AM-OR11-026 TaxID=1314800 RepID=A0A1B7MQV8_9AGAM|nr:hypothetical protein K503DRAFT_404787 [Rhizopogon vinicolor AM-OR11-026]